MTHSVNFWPHIVFCALWFGLPARHDLDHLIWSSDISFNFDAPPQFPPFLPFPKSLDWMWLALHICFCVSATHFAPPQFCSLKAFNFIILKVSNFVNLGMDRECSIPGMDSLL